MQTVPVQPTPNQALTVSLGGQACQVSLRQTLYGLFASLYLDNEPVILGAVCEDRTPLVRERYLGFLGDLVFVDTQGISPPDYTGLGGRWRLMYLSAGESV